MRILLLALVSLSVASPAEARIRGRIQPPRHGPRNEPTLNQSRYDVRSYGIHLAIDPDRRSIQGFVDVTVRAAEELHELELDLLDAFQVSAVEELPGQMPVVFSRPRDLIRATVQLPAGTETTFRIHYAGEPPVAQNAPWDEGFVWARTDSGKPWVGVVDEGAGAYVWIPCKNHPSDEPESVRLALTVPEGLSAVSNGVLRSRLAAGRGWNTFSWETRHPINNYDINFYVGDFAMEEGVAQAKDGRIPVVFYSLREEQEGDQLPEDPRPYAQKRKDLIREAEKYLTFLSDRFGLYPYADEKFGLAHAPYLGMEHQTINAYGNHFKLKDGYDWLLFHEMAHEWWGNWLTARDWKDVWLHEGFAAYAQPLYLETLHGHAYYLEYMKAREQGHIKFDKPVAFRETKDGIEIWEQADVYARGSYVLHSLRFLLGDAVFFAMLRDWTVNGNGAAGGLVSSDDFVATAERHAKRPLRWFFDPLLYRAEAPRLLARRSQGRLELEWEDPEFRLPLEVEFRGPAGTRRVKLELGGIAATAVIAPEESYEVDPDGWVLLDLQRR
jgi:aminopeptidase N